MSEEGKIITTLPKNSTEQIQVALKEFKGNKYLDLRIFYTTDNAQTWLPTKKGVTVTPDNLEALRGAIEQAIDILASEE